MQIQIHIQRPILTGLLILGVVLWWTDVIQIGSDRSGRTSADAEGGNGSTVITEARRDIDRALVQQAVLEKREEILRYDLQILEDQALHDQTPEKVRALAETRTVLLSIIKERGQSEKLLAASLQQLWEAQGTAFTLLRPDGGVDLDWPVTPALGISANFHDEGYKARFGFDHHAIDIPTDQGTPIRAPADGTVLKVSLNGLGYSSITLSHAGGMETVYGHITDATVKAGDTVTFGQIIGHSGGQPGSQGAGLLTTGPHLHFAVRIDGVLVDPLQYLPNI